MPFANDVVAALRRAKRPLDDDVLSAQLRVVRQQVNQTCRRLETLGVLRRAPGADGKIVNTLRDADGHRPALPAPSGPEDDGQGTPNDLTLISEDEVKRAVKSYLEGQGFSVSVAWGRQHGIDLDARRGDDRWIVEAKGTAPRGPQQVNYFLSALGELVQRMDDDAARYAIAVPDNPQYRGLVARLPMPARRRLNLTVFFVRREGGALVVDADLRR